MLKLRSMYMDNDDRMHRAYVTGMLSAQEEATAGTARCSSWWPIRGSRRSAPGCAVPAWMKCRN